MNFQLIKYVGTHFLMSRKRQRFLNFARTIAFLSVMLGTIALIVALSILEGFDSKLLDNAQRFTSHLTIKAYNNQLIDNYIRKLEVIQKNDAVQKVYPIVEREALLRSERSVEGVLIRGVGNNYIDSKLSEFIEKGSYDFNKNEKVIIIGRKLATKLSIDTGSSVILYSINSADFSGLPESNISRFKVSAVYHTGMSQYDESFIYMPDEIAKSFLNIPENHKSSIEIVLNDISKVAPVSEELERALGFPHYIVSVYDIHRAVFAWIEPQKETIPLVLGLISIVAVLNIVTTLLITVVEKTNSISILRSLGMPKKNILSIFVFQGIIIGTLGTLVGSVLAFIFCILQINYGLISLEGNIYFLDYLPIKIEMRHYLIVIISSIILSFVSTLIPAWIAQRINIIRAIRFK